MSTEIIIRDSGPSLKSRFHLNTDGDNIEIVTRDTDSGEITTVFTGKKFSPDAYKEQGGKAQEERYLDLFPPKKKSEETETPA